MKKVFLIIGIIIAFLLIVLIALAVLFFVVIVPNLSCKNIESWDMCERHPLCEPVRFFVTDDYDGPFWKCKTMNIT